MKKYYILIPVIMVLILPQIMFAELRPKQIQGEVISTEATTASKSSCNISVMDGENVFEMDLDEYVVCVLLGEMPAEFESEALKAQAVAIRTYTLRSVQGKSKHINGDVCTNASCCQAFIMPSDYVGGDANLDKVKRAVLDTAGDVITYQGNLIEATYFSCSGGKTEDAVAVWGTEVPYLQSVESPGEESSPKYKRTVSMSRNEFSEKLGMQDGVISADAIKITNSDGGGVETLTINGREFSGVEIRSILSLPSTIFDIAVEGDTVLIGVRGNGHRVGMSQYGAEAMAVAGKTYEQILSHYYTGTEIEKLTEEQLSAIFDKE